jgi:thiamine biosynthesis lipoprotein
MPELGRRRFLRITAVAGVSLALGGGLTRALVRRARLHRVREIRPRIGTLVTITVLHPDAAEARRMVATAFAEMERLEGVLSRHREGTAVAILNRQGVLRHAPVELIEVLRQALAYSELTGGAFDVTVGPLVNLYTERFGRTGQPPLDAEVEDALALVGYRDLQLDDRSVALGRQGMAITLDGIAKGYVVDRTVQRLELEGANQVLVGASGDMASLSRGAGAEAWDIAIQNPRDPGGALGLVQLRGDAVATSGDYLQFYTPDLRFHHIVDPRTGRSPTHTSSVTVLAARAIDADALSTGIFVLGPDAGVRLLDQLPDVAGVIVTKDQRVLRSSRLGAHSV